MLANEGWPGRSRDLSKAAPSARKRLRLLGPGLGVKAALRIVLGV
jgi:hypothetical protein